MARRVQHLPAVYRCCAALLLLSLGCDSEPTVDAADQLALEPLEIEPLAWHEHAAPKAGEPLVFGSYTSGCIQGAVPLLPEGRGYQVMRLERGRFFGHPHLIEYLEELGAAVADDGLGVIMVGDLSQPRGGPMRSDHRSHQSGLDVDIWYRFPEQALERPLTPEERENIPSPAVVDLDTKMLNDEWTPEIGEMLRLAARDERVERIFVHAAVKRELCQQATGDRSWLRKIRPWRLHHDHLHVRLACPPDSDQCAQQRPPAASEGCGASLDSWFRKPPPRKRASMARATKRPSKPRRARGLPEACTEIQR